MLNAMMGWALSFSVLSAAVFWLNFQWQNDRQLVLINQRQNDTRALMTTMVHDLKRSNFQAIMPNKQLGNMGECPSEFCGLTEDFEMSRQQILFSLDRNSNGIKNNNECSGFRLNGKELQTKTSCQPVVWTALNDAKNLQILDLTFRLECDDRIASWGHVVVVDMHFQSSAEKTPLSVQGIVRLRNQNLQFHPASIQCGMTF
jgi:type II secretory pathway component PulJ